MTEPPTISAADLAVGVGGELHGNPDRRFRGLEAIQRADDGQLTFAADDRSAHRWPQSTAGGAVVSRRFVDSGAVTVPDPAGRCVIVVDDAEQAMIDLLERFAPPVPVPAIGTHPTAVIDPSATVATDARIGAHATVGARCRIGAGAVLHPGVRLYDDVELGDGCVVHANCVIRERCTLGRGVILHPGVLIGGDGFGYRPAPDGRGLRKVPQIGTVTVEDGVEIGSGTCIDRAKFGTTLIGAGTKIDNLCQIAHNCRIGRCCVIAGCVALAGSVELADGVMIGGGTCIVEHRRIGAGARIGGMSAVIDDIPAGESWLGAPAGEARAVLRQHAAFRKLPDLIRDAKRATPPDLSRESGGT